MKVSDIRITDLTEYLRLDTCDPKLSVYLSSAKAYIRSYTGMTDIEMDKHEDLVPVIYVLVTHYYENRDYTVQNDKVNKVVQSTLDMYCKNLL